MGYRSKAYKTLNKLNDANAFVNGKIVKRVQRKFLWRMFGKIARWFEL